LPAPEAAAFGCRIWHIGFNGAIPSYLPLTSPPFPFAFLAVSADVVPRTTIPSHLPFHILVKIKILIPSPLPVKREGGREKLNHP
jgi:hypothetical protein